MLVSKLQIIKYIYIYAKFIIYFCPYSFINNIYFIYETDKDIK